MEVSEGPTAAPRSRRPCQTTRTLMHLRSALAALAALTFACGGKKSDSAGVPAGKASAAPPVAAADAAIRDASAAVVPAPAAVDSLLAARAAVTDWIASRRRTPNALDVFLDQYSGDAGGVKVLFVGFSSTDTNAGATLVKLAAEAEGGTTRLVEDKLMTLNTANSHELPLGYGSAPVTDLFPKTWNATVSADGGDCDKTNACDPTLMIMPTGADLIRVPLGTFINNADGEGGTGGYEASLRVIPVTVKELAGTVLVVIDNRESGKAELLARRGLLIGPGPLYKTLWTGDLLGEGCRLSVISAVAGSPEVVYGCGRNAPTTVVLP